MTTSAGPNTPAPDLLVLLHKRADGLPRARLTLADRLRVAFADSRGGEGPVTIRNARPRPARRDPVHGDGSRPLHHLRPRAR